MIDPEGTVASIVLQHSATASVLDRFHIDYCCQGHQALAAACATVGVDVTSVVVELETVSADPDENADPRTAPTSALISRVLAQQHRYLRGTLTLLEHQARHLATDLGAQYPVLRVVWTNLEQVASRMLAHLDHEEDVLFPAVLKGETEVLRVEFAHMFDEHREFGDHFRRLREVTSDYQPPCSDANVVRLFQALAELEGMVGRHHHVENHVLLPRFR